jgi:hypothetical protein
MSFLTTHRFVLSCHLVLGAAALVGCSPDAAVCPSVALDATQLAASPRAEPELEQLALKVDNRATGNGTFMASDETYARIVHDVYEARALEPELEDVTYLDSSDGRSMVVILTKNAYEKYLVGNFHAWDCLNESFEVESTQPRTSGLNPTEVLIRFPHLFNPHMLSREYVGRGAHGIQVALTGAIDENGLAAERPDGPTICLQAGDSTWYYVFVDTDGPCEFQCERGTSYFVTSTPDGEVVIRDVWEEHSAGPRPEFLSLFRNEANCGYKARISSWF